MKAKMGKALLLILVFSLFITLPFITRPFNIDEGNIAVASQKLIEHPFRPLSGPFDLYLGKPTDLFENNHPPFFHYYVALGLWLFGHETEPGLHALMIVWVALCGLGLYWLNRRFSGQPLLATLLFLSSPAFIVMGSSIMNDIPTLALWIGAVTCFIYGLERNDSKLLALSGLSGSLASLTSYNALSLIPLLSLYAILKRKRWKKAWIPFGVWTAIFGLWCLHNFFFNGRLHIISALSSPQFSRLLVKGFTFGMANKAYSLLCGLGGAVLFPPLLLSVSIRRGMKKSFLVLLIMLCLLLTYRERGLFPPISRGLFAFFLFIGLVSFIKVLIWPWLKSPLGIEWKERAFLTLWFAGVFFSTLLVFPFSAVRYLFPLLPPLIIIVVHEAEVCIKPGALKAFLTTFIGLNLMLGLSLSGANYEYSDIYRDFAQGAKAAYLDESNGNLWYASEGGLRAQMRRFGFHYLPSSLEALPEGDLFVKPEVCHTYPISEKLMEKAVHVDRPILKGRLPLHLLNQWSGAGFYSSWTGILPYTLSRGRLEVLNVYKIVEENPFFSQLERAEVKAPSPYAVRVESFFIQGQGKRVLFAHPPASITYSLFLPENSSLAFSIALHPDCWVRKGDGVSFEVWIEDGGEHRLYFQYIDPKHNLQERRWHDVLLNLKEYGGKEVRLTFMTDPGPKGDEREDWAGFGEPELRLATGGNPLSFPKKEGFPPLTPLPERRKQ